MKNANYDLEAAVIGACLLDRNAFPVALSFIDEVPRTFCTAYAFELAWSAMCRLNAQGKPIDIVTVVEALRGEKDFEPAALVQAMNTVSSSANVEAHAAILVEKRIQRDLCTASIKITNAANDPTKDAFQALAEAETEILNVGAIRTSDVRDAAKGAQEVLDQIEAVRASKSGLLGLSCGINSIDAVTQGLQPGRLYVEAGRPGMGKTAYMLTRVRNLAKEGIASLVFSLEMPRQELVGRLIVMESGVPNTRMSKPKSLTAQDMDAITQAAERVASWPVYIYDQASASITSIRAIGRRMKRDKDIAAVFIDYIQLASGERERGGNREQEVSSITRGLKAMAKDLSVPVIALSQLSRAVEARPDKRPQLSDLRESGSIEQDADVVQFLFRPEYYKIMEDEQGQSTEGLVEVITAKNRSGAVGSTMCSWKPWLGLFEDEQDQTFTPALPAYSLNGIERPTTDDDLPF